MQVRVHSSEKNSSRFIVSVSWCQFRLEIFPLKSYQKNIVTKYLLVDINSIQVINFGLRYEMVSISSVIKVKSPVPSIFPTAVQHQTYKGGRYIVNKTLL